MPRVIPDFPKDFENPAVAAGHVFDIELITPLFGGGVAPGQIDAQLPIRPTAIRGQLRHWWRLIRGYSLGAEMWQREVEIFGSTEFPSPVTVQVASPTGLDQFDPKTLSRSSPEAYALFASIENNQRVAREGAQFRLTVHIADAEELLRRRTAENNRRIKNKQPALDQSIQPIANDVHEALAAWLTFGGIGGRTRRGCGAIRCLKQLGTIPQLPARIFLGSAQQTAVAAWRESLAAYQQFRQSPRGKPHRKTLPNGKTIQVPGRSHWPEADSIRKITGCSLKPPQGAHLGDVPRDEDTRDHSAPVAPSALLPAFPRAALGLPINFHFADGPGKGKATVNRDPKDVQLYSLLPGASGSLEKAERMASPIITRPLWRDGKWFPAIIILDHRLPDGMRVRVEGSGASLTGDLSRDLAMDRVINGSLGEIVPMRGKASAIEALIDFLGSGSRKFTEAPQ